MVDFHSHSTASDGRLSPTELVELAASKKLRALALTDHDTISGLDEASKACKKAGILFVPGIEIEIESEFGEFHLLGLGLSKYDSEWASTLGDIQNRRRERNLRIFAKMQESGIRGDFREIEDLAQGGQVGRPHFARFLIQRGKVKNVREAFTHFLGKGQLFYEKKAGLELGTALNMVHGAGGLAVIAHPMTLFLSFPRLEQELEKWKAEGLDGLEAWHPGTEPRYCRRLEALGHKLELKVSAGSDFHGENRPDRKIGITSGETPIADAFFDSLFEGRGWILPIQKP